jgi:hypothetical protein
VGYFHFDTSATRDKGSFLNESADDAESVVERSLSFI